MLKIHDCRCGAQANEPGGFTYAIYIAICELPRRHYRVICRICDNWGPPSEYEEGAIMQWNKCNPMLEFGLKQNRARRGVA